MKQPNKECGLQQYVSFNGLLNEKYSINIFYSSDN